ncbi:MAG: class III extradiol dioxygenase subunit B-like domain-containing protein [Candidatus Doudnabacteria bacterium]
MLSFACISPHPPLLLPSVGSKEDHQKVRKTIKNLEFLGEKLKKISPDSIVISSPHSDWGFNVPLHFLANNFEGEVKPYLTDIEPPKYYFEQGKKMFSVLEQDKKHALIASGDLSHCLKDEGPYGFHPDGPKFDQELIDSLKKKDIQNLLILDEKYPDAGECGLRSFCFVLGILEASGIGWQPEILSYEGPFGVGYLVAEFKLNLS